MDNTAYSVDDIKDASALFAKFMEMRTQIKLGMLESEDAADYYDCKYRLLSKEQQKIIDVMMDSINNNLE